MSIRDATAADAAACAASTRRTSATPRSPSSSIRRTRPRWRRGSRPRSVGTPGSCSTGRARRRLRLRRRVQDQRGVPLVLRGQRLSAPRAAPHRRRPALYEALFARLTARGFRTAVAGMTLPNAASAGLHRALGFEPVGVYRQIGWKLGRLARRPVPAARTSSPPPTRRPRPAERRGFAVTGTIRDTRANAPHRSRCCSRLRWASRWSSWVSTGTDSRRSSFGRCAGDDRQSRVQTGQLEDGPDTCVRAGAVPRQIL